MISDTAFILHKRAYKESSELIKLLTKHNGIVDVIAKGSRRPKSNFKGQLQPFLITEVTFSGRSELKNLINASQQGSLKNCEYKNHVSMLYCSELLTLIQLDTEICHQIFDVYQLTVSELQERTSVSLILRKFEWFLTKNLGYELHIPESINQSDFIAFDPYYGLQVDNEMKVCEVISLRKFLVDQPLNLAEMKQVNSLMKAVVNHLVHGKTIQSRTLLMN